MRSRLKHALGTIWIVACLSMFAIVPFVFGVMFAKDTVALHMHGERIEGEVVFSRSSSHSFRGRHHGPRYTIEYDANADGAAEEVKFGAPLMSYRKEFEVGEKVMIIQDPDDAENAEIDRGVLTFASRYGIAGFAILLGVVAAMFLGFLLKTGKLK